MQTYFSQLTRSCFRNHFVPAIGEHRVAPVQEQQVEEARGYPTSLEQEVSGLSLLEEISPPLKFEQIKEPELLLSTYFSTILETHHDLEQSLVAVRSLSAEAAETLIEEYKLHDNGIESLEDYVTALFNRRQTLLYLEKASPRIDIVDRRSLLPASQIEKKENSLDPNLSILKTLDLLLSIQKRWKKELSSQKQLKTDCFCYMDCKRRRKQIQAIVALQNTLRIKPKGVLFSQDPVVRSREYEKLAGKLFKLLTKLSDQQIDAAFTLGEGSLSELPEVCYTGWEERIESFMPPHQLCTGKGIIQFTLSSVQPVRQNIAFINLAPALIKRAAPEMVGETHYQKAARRVLSRAFSLDTSEESLGRDEEDITQFLRSYAHIPRLRRLFQKTCLPSHLMKQLKKDFSSLNAWEKENLRTALVDLYERLACDQPALLFDRKVSLQILCAQARIANERETIQRSHILATLHAKMLEQENLALFSLQLKTLTTIHQELMSLCRKSMQGVSLSAGFSAVEQLIACCNKILSLSDIEEETAVRCQCILQQLRPLTDHELYHARHKTQVSLELNRVGSIIASWNVASLRAVMFEGGELTDAGAAIMLVASGLIELSEIELSAGECKTPIRAILESFRKALFLEESQDPNLTPEQWSQHIYEDSVLIRFAPPDLLQDRFFVLSALLNCAQSEIPLLLKSLPRQYQTEGLLLQAITLVHPSQVPELVKEMQCYFKSLDVLRKQAIERCSPYRIPALLKAYFPIISGDSAFLVSLFKKCSLLKKRVFLNYLPYPFKSDFTLMSQLLLLTQDHMTLQFVSHLTPSLHQNTTFMLSVVDQCPDFLVPELSMTLHIKHNRDHDFMMVMLRKCSPSRLPSFYEALHSSLQAKSCFAHAAVEKCLDKHMPQLFEHMPPFFYWNKELVLQALQRCCPSKIARLVEQLDTHSGHGTQFLVQAIRLSDANGVASIFSHIPLELRENDPFVLGLLQQLPRKKRNAILQSMPFKRRTALYFSYNLGSF